MIWFEGTIGRDPWPLVLRTVDTHLRDAVRDVIMGDHRIRTAPWEAARRAIASRELAAHNPSAPGTAYPRLNLDLSQMFGRRV